jgi:hypothetical protein
METVFLPEIIVKIDANKKAEIHYSEGVD